MDNRSRPGASSSAVKEPDRWLKSRPLEEWSGAVAQGSQRSCPEMTTVLRSVAGDRSSSMVIGGRELQKVLKFSGVAPRRHIREPRSVHGQLEES
jgi:hypothetical protein